MPQRAVAWFEWRIAAIFGLIAFALMLAGLLRHENDRDFDTRYERAERSIHELSREIDRTLDAQEADQPTTPTS